MTDLLADSLALYRSRWKALLMLLGALAFVAIGLVFVLSMSAAGWIVGVICVAFFGLAAAYLAAEVVRARPTVLVNRDGVTVRAHLGAAGFVPWDEITGAFIYQVGRQRMLALGVVDEDAVAARMTPIGRFFLKANRGLGYPVVNIPQTAVSDDLLDVVRHLQRFRPDLRYTVDD